MPVELRPHTLERINRHLRDGRYATIDEVVAAGLRLLEEREATVAAARAHVTDAHTDPLFAALLAGMPPATHEAR